MTPLMPVDDALARVLASLEGYRQPIVSLDLLPALGRVLAEDVISPIAVPGEDNSAMDGYALRAADATGTLPVSQRIPAGTIGSELAQGTAARIFTGAAIPPGADAVVMQENCEASGGLGDYFGVCKRRPEYPPQGAGYCCG